jgi:hypothetical protein
MVWSLLWDPFDNLDIDDIFYHINHDFAFVSDDSFFDEDFSDTSSDSSDDSPFVCSPEKKQSQRDRRRRAKELQETRKARLLLATVYQLSKDNSSYLSVLPHEIVSLIMSYCDCSENDLRLMSQGFDYVGMAVTVPLPLLSRSREPRDRKVISGFVSGYDIDCDEHQLCLVNGERIKVQVNGIGKNGCQVTFGETSAPTSGISHPTSPQEISYVWLKHILKYSRDFEYAVDCVGMESGDTCQTCAIHVHPLDCEDADHSLFLKFSLPHSPNVEEIWQSGCYQREAYFYNALLENMPQSLAPRVHLAHCDYEQRQSLIVLQDMRMDVESCVIKGGFRSYQVARLLQSLALLHASWWDSHLLSKYFAESSRGHAHQITFTPLHSLVSRLNSALPLLKGLLPATLHNNADSLKKDVRFIYTRFAQRSLTLCHCDVRPEHTFIPSSPARLAVLVDWQRCSLGVAIRDVTTVLASCEEGLQYEGWHQEMVSYYSTELRRCVPEYAGESDCFNDFCIYALLYMSELVVALWKARQQSNQSQHISYIERTLHCVIQTVIKVKSFDVLREYVSTVVTPGDVETIPPPFCYHSEPAVRRRMPSGIKKGDLFFSCPRFEIGKECSFFRWTTAMDKNQGSGVPLCVAHEKATEVRYSLLPETLGRGYYCCSETENPCKFKKWVENATEETGRSFLIHRFVFARFLFV